MNQLEAFVANLEKSLSTRYQVCPDTATPSTILLAVLNAVSDAKAHLHDMHVGTQSSAGDDHA